MKTQVSKDVGRFREAAGSWSFASAVRAAIGICLFAGSASAATLTASVDRAVVELGGEIKLTLAVTGVRGAPGGVSLPELDGFTARSGGTSTQIVNMVVSRLYQFYLTPTRTGTLEIPTFTMKIHGQEMASNPIAITVVKGSAGLLVEVKLSKTTVYAGEPTVVEFRLLVPSEKVRDVRGAPDVSLNWLPDFTGFRVFDPESLADRWQAAVRSTGKGLAGHTLVTVNDQSRSVARVVRENREGRPYVGYLIRRVMVPMTTGDYSLGSAGGRITMRGMTRRSSFFKDPFFDDPFFNDPFFGGRLSARFSEPRVASAAVEPVMLKVLPLPEEGRPDCFSGGVGIFTVAVRAEPETVTLGDTITLTMTVSGTGSFESITAPVVEQTGDFTVGDVERNVSQRFEGGRFVGEKVFVQPLRPKRAGALKIPPTRFGYFDSTRGEYAVIESKKMPVSVLEPEEGTATLLVESAPQQVGSDVTRLGVGLFDIETRVGTLHTQTNYLYKRLLGFFLLVAPPLAFALTALLVTQRRRLREDENLARRRSALKAVRAGLDRIRRAQEGASPAETISRCASMLTGYLADKSGRPAGEITPQEASEIMKKHGVTVGTVGLVRDFLESCERARFAGAGGEDAAGSIETARRLVGRLEKEFRG